MTLDDLKPFCSTDSTRFQMVEPFTMHGWTYATDGRILVGVSEVLPGARGDIALKVREVIPSATGHKPVELPAGWQDWPESTQECRECKGIGSFKRCSDCHGEGYIKCHACGHEDRCDTCKGQGSYPGEGKPCEYCDGSGKVAVPVFVYLNRGAVIVDRRYLRLALTLPGVRLTYRNDASPLRIEFAHGEGAIMPVWNSEDYSHEIARQWPGQPAPA